MVELDTPDQAALDAFRSELVAAGFEPRPGTNRWEGPLPEALSPLTEAKTMRLCLHDGFPYRYPTIYVDGIAREHAVTDGEVCLFQPGEGAIGSWITFSALKERIAAWAEAAQAGLRDVDKLLDANLFYRPKMSGLATVELDTIAVPDAGAEAKGKLWGRWKGSGLLRLSTTKFEEDAIPGRWYYCPKLPDSGPPRDLESLIAALSKGQAVNFARRLDEVGPEHSRVILFVWEHYGQRTAIALQASQEPEQDLKLRAIENIAFEDESILSLRAGPDRDVLEGKRVAVFGCGAIGSNLACRLAEAGTGTLRLVDADIMRPGNIVRHAASFRAGLSKVRATAFEIEASAPWTEVDEVLAAPWGPQRIGELISDVDLVVETTGSTAFAGLLSVVTSTAEKPMITAALYRSGFVARVRRQVPGRDTAISERTDPERYPLIPKGEEPFSVETGCSALVNNASPVAVAAVAASCAEVAIDALAGRFAFAEELIDVYRPLEEAPFDSIGRLRG